MEEHILKFLKAKDHQKAFDAIVDTYSERLYWHIRRMVHLHEDADDVLQNTFIKIWKNLATFRGDSQLFTWLYRIATNEALGHLRSKKAIYLVGDNPAPSEYAHRSGDIYFDGEQASAKLALAVSSLPEKQRAVFNLKYFEEMKYGEMSKVMGTSVGALKASYHHAVSKVRKFLESTH